MTIKNILVPTDFGDPANVALEYGRQLARALGAALHLLHVVGNVAAEPIGVEGFTTDFTALQREAEEAARRQLGATITDEDRRSGVVKAMTVTSNAPASAIASYVKEAAIDLVIVGTHTREDLLHEGKGSVASRILRTAPCPVLIVGD